MCRRGKFGEKVVLKEEASAMPASRIVKLGGSYSWGNLCGWRFLADFDFRFAGLRGTVLVNRGLLT